MFSSPTGSMSNTLFCYSYSYSGGCDMLLLVEPLFVVVCVRCVARHNW